MPKLLDRAPLPSNAASSRLLSARETQEYLGVSKKKLYEMTFKYKDRLPSFKIGNSRKYRLDQVNFYVDSHQEPM